MLGAWDASVLDLSLLKVLFIPFDVDIQLLMGLIIYYVTYLKSVKSFSKGQT